MTTSYTVRALSKLTGKPLKLVEDTWRQARDFIKATEKRGRYDLVLKTCLDMLGVKASIDRDGSIDMFGVSGSITESTSAMISVKTEAGQVNLPLILLVFNKL